MNDLFIVIAACLTVAMVFLPLIGAQKKSLKTTESLYNKVIHFNAQTEDSSKKESINFMMLISRSWLASVSFLFLGPLLAFKNALKIKKVERTYSKEERELYGLFAKSLFLSNPITMGIAIVLIALAIALGSILLFSFLSLWSLGGDSSKLDTPPSKPGYELVNNISSMYSVYKSLGFIH